MPNLLREDSDTTPKGEHENNTEEPEFYFEHNSPRPTDIG